MSRTLPYLVMLCAAVGPLGGSGTHATADPATAARGNGGASGAGPAAATVRVDGGWRAARWGMTVEEVLAAFQGEARALEPPLNLADGNVVAAGIERFDVGGHPFRVRFVFEAGRLALVSLRTPPESPARAEAYVELQRLLAELLGGPGEATADDAFIDMRQTRWKAGRSAIDLNYVPGVVVILYHPP
jgi:hypothetical protein